MYVLCKRINCHFNKAVEEEDVGICERTRTILDENGCCLSFDKTTAYYIVEKRKTMKELDEQ